MAWERRARGGLYYTRSRREGGKVVREYFGCGAMAEAVAHLATSEREKVHRRKRKVTRVHEELNAADEIVTDFFCRVETAVTQVIEAAGYHRHQRGEWRKKRQHTPIEYKEIGDSSVEDTEMIGSNTNVPAIRPSSELGISDADGAQEAEARKERQKLVTKGMKSASKADQELALACLREHPGENLKNRSSARSAMIMMASGKHPVFMEMLSQECNAQFNELAGDNSTALEKVLIERIVVCQLQLTHYERVLAGVTQFDIEETTNQSNFNQKRLDRLHHRHLSAIKALAQVRRLQIPAVQLNIAENQVNLSTGK